MQSKWLRPAVSLARAFEEQELPPDLKRIYCDIRTSLDLPFVPTIFKLLAGRPAYLKLMWDDLDHVARSREFHSAARALGEFVRSLVINGGWQFSDQEKILAAQKFSPDDMEAMANLPPIFTHAFCQMAILTRLMQRGYAGGQRGRVTEARQASALSRMVSLNVPGERDAGLRVWLIYSDIKKATGGRAVMSMFRILSPYPGYLASVWLDAKKTLAEPAFLHARDELAKRVAGLVVGMPVKDHRIASKAVASAEWREIEETVDGFARLLPQFALLSAVWQRSFVRIHWAAA